jgi:type I restriction enzyme S subunit
MTDGLKPQYRRAIIETLSANPKVERVVLFGSRAMGTFTPTSDIDLALFGGDLTLSDQAALTEAMAELAIPQRVDILIHHRVENQALREHIRKHGVEWFARKRATGKLATAELRPSCASNKRKAPMSTPPSAPTARSSGITGEWTTASLAELCDFRAGSVFTPSLQGRSSGEFPFVKVSDMNLPANAVRIQDANNWVSAADLKQLRAKPFPPGTVIFAKIGEALRQNRLRQVARETIVDNNLMGAVPRADRIDPLFFYYALSQFDFSDIARGTALPYLTVGSLSGLTLDLPPLPEQRAIAHILGTLDDKIELNRRMSETLEAMARALFQSWFVDFDPVRAKAEGRDPGLPDEIAKLFPDALTEHPELGEIPEGWEVQPFESLASVKGGKQLPTKKCRPTGSFPVYGANGVMGFSDHATHDGFIIAFGRVGAYCGSVHWTYSGAWINNNASAVVPLNWPEFVLQTMLSVDFVNMRTGSAQPFIPNKSLAAHPVIRPPATVLEAYCRLARPLRLRDQAVKQECKTLATLRDALLPKLISGELRVKDAEGFLKERAL